MNNKQLLKKRIQHIELQIKKLNTQALNNAVCEDLYNSLILQKAVLKKQLENLDKNPILEKFKQIILKKEKLICDYFRG